MKINQQVIFPNSLCSIAYIGLGNSPSTVALPPQQDALPSKKIKREPGSKDTEKLDPSKSLRRLVTLPEPLI